MSFTKRQKVLIELCVRSILTNLLNEETDTISDFIGILSNINNGVFGKREYKFQDPTDWESCKEDLLFIIAKIRFESQDLRRNKLREADARVNRGEATVEDVELYVEEFLDIIEANESSMKLKVSETKNEF